MKLYFGLVIKFDKKVNSKLKELTHYVAKKYKTKAAFNDPKGPHITMAYFDTAVKTEDIKKIINRIRVKLSKAGEFNVKIDGIRSFRKERDGIVNYVVYIRPVKNKHLSKIYRICNRETKKYKIWPPFKIFVPHITLARKDLDKTTFYNILKEFNGYNLQMNARINCIYSMTRCTRKEKWHEQKLLLT
ncbi:MAG: 2'-5' RNA ligase family protein [Candidatus Micrarchaeales archaeon]